MKNVGSRSIFIVLLAGTLSLAACGPAAGLLGDIKTIVNPPAEIQLRVRGSVVASGGSVSLGNALPSESASCSVVIYNTDTDREVHLAGSPLVAIGGTDAGCFSITSQPSSTIEPQSQTTFIVACTPDTLGMKRATLTVRSDDLEESTYVVNVVSAGALATGNTGRSIAMGTSGSAVSVLYSDSDAYTLNYRGSEDDGQTFASAVTVDTDTYEAPCYATLAVDGSNLHAVYFLGSAANLFYKGSSDGGSSWTARKTIVSSPDPRYNGVSVSGSTVLVGYYDYLTESKDVYSIRSTDGGTTWESSVGIESDGDVGAYCATAISGTTAYIAYYDTDNKNLKCVRSTDSGASWGSPVVVATAVDGAFSTESHPISIAISGSAVVIVFFDYSTYELKSAYSSDGMSWSSDTVHVIASANDIIMDNAAMAISGTTLYVAYYDSDGLPAFAGSSDWGTSWTTTVVDPYIYGSRAIGLAVSTNAVCIAYSAYYYNSGTYSWDLLFARSTDGGATWQ
jgi:hypothetical protein